LVTTPHSVSGPSARRISDVFVRPVDRSDRVKPEIQALRAVAVGAVVIFHFWPARLPGGYVGVDVFFVISGYLIIGSLVREVGRSGRVHLIEFWARRARRLMPASIVTLLAVSTAIVLWVPQVSWIQFVREVGAAGAYVLNWVLAADSVDYLASQNAPSPVQHFWSLSVEEQFYVAWPLLIVIMALLARGRSTASRQRLLTAALVVVVVASAIYSVIATQENQASAYFFTTTRAWEFGVGGLLAMSANRLTNIPVRFASGMAWVGLVLIAVAASRFNATTAFPGLAAWLPVVGSLLVIAAGLPSSGWSPSPLYRLRPVQWAGDISYSLYLWHWPLLVIAPLALRHPSGTATKIILLIAALVISSASKRFIEDPFRQSDRLKTRGPWFATVSTVVITALILTGSLVWTGSMEAHIAQSKKEALQAIASDGSSCLGASAFGPGRTACLRPFAVNALTDPASAATDIGQGVQVSDKCKQTAEDSEVIVCQLGVLDHPARHIALIGDSHAGVFLEPLGIYAKQHGWQVTTYLKTWCMGTGVPHVAAPDNLDKSSVQSCARWGSSALQQIAADPTIDAVIFSNFTRHYDEGSLGTLGRPVTAADVISGWKSLMAVGKKVLVIRDTPVSVVALVPECVAEHLSDYDPCPTPRSAAVASADPQWAAAQSTLGVTGIDLSDDFCDAAVCHSVIGGLIVYFDTHHLTATFARTMAPYLGSEIQHALN
jgi:peptidoglycan/LPS O-acetylase OafA/YrhL